MPPMPAARATLSSAAPTRSRRPEHPRRLDAACHHVDQQQRDDPDRHVQQEDPLPAGHVEPRDRHVEAQQHPGAVRRADRHADVRRRALQAEGRGALAPAKQVAGEGHRQRHQRATAEALHHAPADQPGQTVLGTGQPRQAGPGAADDEQQQRDDVQPPRSPQVGAATGQGHGDDVRQQVGVHDPADPPQVRPAAEVGHDRGQRDGHDHQLGAAEQDTEAGDDQRRPRRDRMHPDRLRRRLRDGHRSARSTASRASPRRRACGEQRDAGALPGECVGRGPLDEFGELDERHARDQGRGIRREPGDQPGTRGDEQRQQRREARPRQRPGKDAERHDGHYRSGHGSDPHGEGARIQAQRDAVRGQPSQHAGGDHAGQHHRRQRHEPAAQQRAPRHRSGHQPAGAALLPVLGHGPRGDGGDHQRRGAQPDRQALHGDRQRCRSEGDDGADGDERQEQDHQAERDPQLAHGEPGDDDGLAHRGATAPPPCGRSSSGARLRSASARMPRIDIGRSLAARSAVRASSAGRPPRRRAMWVTSPSSLAG